MKGLFESGRGLLRLDWHLPTDDTDVDPPTESVWFHISYVNQSSWAAGLLQMHIDKDPDNRRVARAAGNIALRAAPEGLEMLDAGDDPFDAWGLKTCPIAFLDSDLTRLCSYSMLALAEGGRIVEDFKPADVEVYALPGKPSLFWHGGEMVAEVALGIEENSCELQCPDDAADGDPNDTPPLEDGDPACDAREDLWAELMEEIDALQVEAEAVAAPDEAASAAVEARSCWSHVRVQSTLEVCTQCLAELCFRGSAFQVFVASVARFGTRHDLQHKRRLEYV